MVTINLMYGDCLDRLKDLDDNSVDSIVTDPPYGLSKEPDMIEVLKHWMNGDDYVHNSKGFMGKDWDSFVPGPSIWKECLRVLKPGGHMIAFFGTRTYDMGVLSIRIAGFEVRNQLAWVFGSGFPKSLNISKAIDKAAGAERKVIGTKIRGSVEKAKNTGVTMAAADANKNNKAIFGYGVEEITVPETDEAKYWEGWGTDLKPAFEPIVLARKPLSEKTVAANVLKWGTGGINIDDCRVPANGDNLGGGSKDKHNFAGKDGWDRPWMHDEEKVKQNKQDRLAKVEKAEQLGRFPANLILSYSDKYYLKENISYEDIIKLGKWLNENTEL
jgi:site-specific DNA-methyltransferase (adenine-specific)